MKNKKAKIYVNGKEVTVEKIKKQEPEQNRPQDHVIQQMNIGPIKQVVYRKLLDALDQFIDDRLGPR